MHAPLNVKMDGKVALVTGSTSGLGKEIARGLARMGAQVILPARSLERAEAVRQELATSTGNTNLSVMKLDMASLDSIRAFVAELQSKTPKLHLVINNAGAWFTDRRESPDGNELQLATNVLGPYLLNDLLTDLLKASGPSRILNVVSSFAANYDVGDLQFSGRKYDGFKAYGQSKQALRMLSFGLAKKLEGSGVTVNAVEPGFVRTDLNRNAKGMIPFLINVSAKLFATSPEEGADTPLWAAVAPELETTTGKFLGGRKEKDSKFREPEPIAELEKACEQLVSKVRAGAPGPRAASPSRGSSPAAAR